MIVPTLNKSNTEPNEEGISAGTLERAIDDGDIPQDDSSSLK